MFASVLGLGLLAMPAAATHIWAIWDLDLGGHAPPTHFVLTVTSPTGAGVPPPMTVPWKTCTQPEMPATSYCAPIGCPPTGTYVFAVQAQYAEGLSAPSNAYTCAIPSPSSVCECTQGTPKPSTLPDYRALFPQLPERTRLCRLFMTHHAWTQVFLASPTVLGVIDT